MKGIHKPLFVSILAPLALLLCSQLLVTGCEREPEITDPAQRLLYSSMKAMGGSNRVTSWSSRMEQGTLKTEWPGWGHLTADCTRWVVKPDKIKIDNDFSAYDHPFFMTYYLNGDTAWVVVNMGVRQHPQYTQQLKDFAKRLDWIGYYAAQGDTFFLVEPVPDDSLVAGSSIDRVGVVDGGDTILIDLDKETHLVKRMIQNGGAVQFLYDDYRQTGRIKVPHHISVLRSQGADEEFTWDRITYDPAIDPKVFEEDKP